MTTNTTKTMMLGNFSVSFTVKDLAASMAFYEKLGFTKLTGDGQGWIILRNGAATVGLFQGMFERNMLTFNPGWDADGRALERFTDVRELLRQVKAAGIEPVMVSDATGKGPASFTVADPDGNPVLFDQHV
ncbi:MAG TPA: VOC family protein [Myxococcaceae bacterium]|jgi:catechol 2,3-dioxygenase-like lactoylglutathione lyase family enzyme